MLEAGVKLMKMRVPLFLLIITVLMVGIAYGAPIEVHATEVLKKIALGDGVSYDGAVIIGDLDLGRLNLTSNNNGKGIVASRISIINSIFEDKVNFSGHQFASNVDLSGTSFMRDADFSGCDFAGKANFNGARFLGYADFYATTFTDIDCIGAIFYKDASFNNTIFNIYYSDEFDNTIFKGYAGFMAAVFRGYTYFTGTEFDGYANFFRSEFYQETRLDGARFLGYANFNESRFKDYVYFNGVQFEGPLSLNKTKMPDGMIDWSSIKGHLVYNEAAYQALMQRLWALGNFDDYDSSYYQYRWQKQSYEPIGISKAVDIFACVSCGYGVMPQQTLALGLMIIVLFGIIYWRLKMVPIFHSDKREGSMMEAMYFSTMMFVTRPPYGLHPVGRWRYLIVLEYVSGWLIMALFLVTMGRLMIR
jgi:uncharacterized protein YjbI with pentapeptide repeats